MSALSPRPPKVKFSERLAKRRSPQSKPNAPPAKEKNTTINSKVLKWILAISLIGNAMLAIWLLAKPDAPKPPLDLSKYTQQDLRKANHLSAGMRRTDVSNLMGEPAVKEISGHSEEWHYCQTGGSVDEYVAVSFTRDSLAGLQYYTVSWLDLAFHYVKQPTEKLIDAGGMGDCRLTIRWGTYNQRTPSYPVDQPARSRNTEPQSSAPTSK